MVRIPADKAQRRTAWISLLGALGAGALAIAALSVFRDDASVAASQRTLTDTPVLWTCELDPSHEFTADGRYDPLPCRRFPCAGRCFIHLRFICLAHDHEFDVWVQFERRPGAEGHKDLISQYRYQPRGPWHKSTDGRVPCPLTGCSSETRPVSTAWSARNARPQTPERGNQAD